MPSVKVPDFASHVKTHVMVPGDKFSDQTTIDLLLYFEIGDLIKRKCEGEWSLLSLKSKASCPQLPPIVKYSFKRWTPWRWHLAISRLFLYFNLYLYLCSWKAEHHDADVSLSPDNTNVFFLPAVGDPRFFSVCQCVSLIVSHYKVPLLCVTLFLGYIALWLCVLAKRWNVENHK